MTTPCTAHLWGDPDGLTCTRPESHDSGHVYESTTGQAHCAKEEM